jgi:hypothetical protein
MICEIIVHLLVTVQNNKRCTVQRIAIRHRPNFAPELVRAKRRDFCQQKCLFSTNQSAETFVVEEAVDSILGYHARFHIHNVLELSVRRLTICTYSVFRCFSSLNACAGISRILLNLRSLQQTETEWFIVIDRPFLWGYLLLRCDDV